MAVTDEALGPGFDTVTLTRPTPRKLVCLWMEQAGLRTVLLPTVWRVVSYGASSCVLAMRSSRARRNSVSVVWYSGKPARLRVSSGSAWRSKSM